MYKPKLILKQSLGTHSPTNKKKTNLNLPVPTTTRKQRLSPRINPQTMLTDRKRFKEHEELKSNINHVNLQPRSPKFIGKDPKQSKKLKIQISSRSPIEVKPVHESETPKFSNNPFSMLSMKAPVSSLASNFFSFGSEEKIGKSLYGKGLGNMCKKESGGEGKSIKALGHQNRMR